MYNNKPVIGVLKYDESYNLGDEVQSLAACNLLGFQNVNLFLDRNTGKEEYTCEYSPDKLPKNVIYNGWFHSKYSKFPPPNDVKPLFISFHINTDNHANDKRYEFMDRKHKITQPSIENNIEYLKQHEPIGCRDLHTVKLLKSKGVDAYFSGCLTLSLQNPYFDFERTDEILVIDAHIAVPNLYKEVIPEEIRNKAVCISQSLSQQKDRMTKFKLAQEHIHRLAKAKLVITTRLHSTLPCLALNTPVILLCENTEDIRLKTYLPYVKFYKKGDTLETDFDMLSYKNPKNDDLFHTVSKSVKKVKDWLYKLKNTPMSTYISELKEGYSFVAVCMNRTSFLNETIQTWVNAKPDEIIVVDWNTIEVPSVHSIVSRVRTQNPHFKDKLKLIRVSNVNAWSLTRSYNLAFEAASFDKVLKLDCDSKLDPKFLLYHNLERGNVFFSGDWTKARDENERHTNGIVFLKKKDFEAVNGYNEYIQGYGYDDTDLYNRLAKISKRFNLNTDLLSHLDHSNNIRIENISEHDKKAKYRLDVQIEKNRLISENEKWEGPISTFTVVQEWNKGDMEVQLESFISLDPEKDSLYFEKAVLNRSYVMKNKKKRMFVQVVNGLGNRLRCLASACVIAKATNRELTIIWIPDTHCEAKFTDLFDENFITDFHLVHKAEKVEDILKNYVVNDSGEISSTTITFRDIVKVNLTHPNDKKPLLDYYNYSTSPNEYINDTEDDIFVVSACVLNNKNTNWHKESLILRYLRPKEEITKKVFQTEFAHNSFSSVIGIHIRMGQDPEKYKFEDVKHYNDTSKYSVTKWRKASSWTAFSLKMDDIIKNNPRQVFYLACDSEEAYEEILKTKKYKIIYTKRESYDRSLEQNKTALIDLYLLSKCKYILGSNWSSYSEIAHRLSGKEMLIAGVDF